MGVMRTLLLLSALVYAIQASPITYSVTANSYYPARNDPTSADAYVLQAFHLQLSTLTTLTFSVDLQSNTSYRDDESRGCLHDAAHD